MTDSTRAVDHLGARVRAERDAQGLSRAALAARSGLSRDTITGIESGRTPTLTTLTLLAEALGLPLPALFTGPAPRPVAPLPEGFDVWPLEIRDTGAAQIETYRIRLTREIHQDAGAPGARGYLTVTAGRMTAGSAATPRRLDVGGQLAFALDHPHVYRPEHDTAEAVLVLRYPHTTT